MDTPTIPIDAINRDIAAREDARRNRRPIRDIGNPSEINREVAAALTRHVSPDDVARTIASLLGATRTLKDGRTIDDPRAQEAGVKLWLAYSVGLPVQRQEIVNVQVDADQSAGLKDRLAKSPALRRALAAMLAEHSEEDSQTGV